MTERRHAPHKEDWRRYVLDQTFPGWRASPSQAAEQPLRTLPGRNRAFRRSLAKSHQGCIVCHRPLNPFGSCTRRDCPSKNFPLWVGDNVAKCRENIDELLNGGPADMLTVTGPGADQLPWDTDHCAPLSSHKCSGLLGCRVKPNVAYHWNRSAPARLTRLLDAAHARLRYEDVKAGRAPSPRPAWIALPEVHKRGILHWHIVYSARDRPYVRRLLQSINKSAGGFGFGRAQLELGKGTGSKGVGYVYKTVSYLMKSAAESSRERDELMGIIRGPLRNRPYIRCSPRLTSVTGATMRNFRLRRYIHVRSGCPEGPPLSCQAVAMIRGFMKDREALDEHGRLMVRTLRSTFCDLPPPPPFAGQSPSALPPTADEIARALAWVESNR